MTSRLLALSRLPHVLPLALALAAVLSLFHVFDWLARPVLGPLLDAPAEEVAQGIALRAGAAFAVSKTINAALSFAEEVTVTGDAFIVEGSVHPAALLKPVNNLVDQFARIMLVVAASALLIEFLLHIGAGYGTWVLLALPLALFAVHASARGTSLAPRIRRLAAFALLLAVLVRVALPVALVTTGAISDRFLADRFEQANAGMEVLRDKSDQAAEAAEVAEDGSWTKSVLDSVRSAFAIVREKFGETFTNIVTMVTVFVLETIVLPVVVVLALWRGLFLVAARGERSH